MRNFTIVRTPLPTYISTEAQAYEWLEFFAHAARSGGLGVDTETTGLDIMRDRVRFFSLAVADQRVCAPVRLLPIFAPLLEDVRIEKRLTNSKYDMHLLLNAGVQLRGHILDTADMDFVVDENRQGMHGLKECAQAYLGLRMTPFKEVFGSAGSTEDEVAMLCEIHDLLELVDYEGEVVEGEKRARDIVLRLGRVSGSPEVLKAAKKLHLSLRADKCTLSAKQVISIAETFGIVSEHSGVHRHVSEFVQLLNPAVGELPPKERRHWVELTERAPALREVTEIVYECLLELAGMPSEPVEFLRESVADYASLDAWASHQLVDHFRNVLVQDNMIMVTEAVEQGATPRLLLEHVEDERVPFLQTLWNMERRGFKINVAQTAEYAASMQIELDDVDRQIVRETRDLSFNPSSPSQLLERFFTQGADGRWQDPFGDEPKKWTSGGQSGTKLPSTNKEVLEEFAGKGDVLARLILQHRQLRKLKTDYMEGLPSWVDRRCRIHTSLKSTGARTWRLSSNNPNLQNIPVRDEKWGKRIRRLFIPGLYGDCDPNWCLEHLRDVPVPDLPPDAEMTLIVADYKQLEMCILAHFSGDEAMIEAIRAKKDLHCMTVALASALGAAGLPRGITYEMAKAAKDFAGALDTYNALVGRGDKSAVRPTPPDGMTEHEALRYAHARAILKATGFGIVYGIGEVKLGMQLKLPIIKRLNKKTGRTRDTCPEAAELIRAYLHDIFPGVGEFIAETQERCREDLVVYTVAGHPRRLPDIVSSDRAVAAQAERQAPNSRIQGSAADICNRAMLLCESDEELRRLGVRMLMQIHDELIFECPIQNVEAAKKRIRELMENPFLMRVPVLIDMSTAQTWGDAKG